MHCIEHQLEFLFQLEFCSDNVANGIEKCTIANIASQILGKIHNFLQLLKMRNFTEISQKSGRNKIFYTPFFYLFIHFYVETFPYVSHHLTWFLQPIQTVLLYFPSKSFQHKFDVLHVTIATAIFYLYSKNWRDNISEIHRPYKYSHHEKTLLHSPTIPSFVFHNTFHIVYVGSIFRI